MKRLRLKVGSIALVISLVIHLIIAAVLGIRVAMESEIFRDVIGVEMIVTEPPKPKIRKPIRRPISVAKQSATLAKPVLPENRSTASRRRSSVAQTTSKFVASPKQQIDLSSSVSPVMSEEVKSLSERVLPPDRFSSKIPTTIDGSSKILSDESPDIAPDIGSVSEVDRGAIPDFDVQVKAFSEAKIPGLKMAHEVGVKRDLLGDVESEISLGNIEVQPLKSGEPGGKIVGRGSDLRGVLRFVRVRHNLSDWWADTTALNALVAWINDRTKIKADMNVAGGAVRFTDANLMKCPLVFMTGHDPAVVKKHSLFGPKYGSNRKLSRKLSKAEMSSLRRYLVEKGGLLVFDDCGMESPAQPMTRLFVANLRQILPEYPVKPIPNEHPIYNIFYKLGGAPTGYSVYWPIYNRLPKMNYLEGVSINGKLSVLIIRRDYMCAMETISLGGRRKAHYSPEVYRLMTNVAIYAMTTGTISDYEGYIPEDRLLPEELPLHAPDRFR